MERSRLTLIIAVAALLACVQLCGHAPPPTRAASIQPVPPVTYYHDVQPILARSCVGCHDGSGRTAAPFSLQTYREVENRAAQIAQVTKGGYMPPWKPDSHGIFVGERSLSPAEIATLSNWSALSAPQGSPASSVAYHPPVVRGIGKPDLILTSTAALQLPADGTDSYRCTVFSTHFAADKYLAAITYLPANAVASDHALIYADPAHRVRFLHSLDGSGSFAVRGSDTGLQTSMLIGVSGRGSPPELFPSGSGILLPKDADIVLETHYRPTGKAERDRPEVGLYFCKRPVTHRVRIAPLLAQNLRLPPGDPFVGIGGQIPVRSNIEILSVAPYLRSHGTAVSIYALLPNRAMPQLLSIPDWDFDWIGDYTYKSPQLIPAGSLINLSATFTNASSAAVPDNQAQPITWGDTPQDENAVAYLFYTAQSPAISADAPAGIPDLGAPTTAGVQRILLKMFDLNHDGTIDAQEMQKMRQYFRGTMPSMAGMDEM